ncbi:small acid-soluble spore protein SspI [Bacillus sp. RG28]|uniref:Small, acid-soluble spore protein I n=1 Tax=Gottfriedia endophytica TaxID=2820819 RepID=A0A940NK72_9BACI|nr:small acid-soluble spore protein SspI [Gottfriedia endophytica]MBP0724011.1 small acid-soluble spore protein SspI [Gottfriedia endophytica]
MNFNIRGAVIHNITGNSTNQLEATIVDAIQSGEEKILPGLGVLLEVFWNNASEQQKHELLDVLENGVKK